MTKVTTSPRSRATDDLPALVTGDVVEVTFLWAGSPTTLVGQVTDNAGTNCCDLPGFTLRTAGHKSVDIPAIREGWEVQVHAHLVDDIKVHTFGTNQSQLVDYRAQVGRQSAIGDQPNTSPSRQEKVMDKSTFNPHNSTTQDGVLIIERLAVYTLDMEVGRVVADEAIGSGVSCCIPNGGSDDHDRPAQVRIQGVTYTDHDKGAQVLDNGCNCRHDHWFRVETKRGTRSFNGERLSTRAFGTYAIDEIDF